MPIGANGRAGRQVRFGTVWERLVGRDKATAFGIRVNHASRSFSIDCNVGSAILKAEKQREDSYES
jgi:hypothetical protein